MSYRYRFAITNKNIVDKMRNMSYPELVDYIKNNIPEKVYYNQFGFLYTFSGIINQINRSGISCLYLFLH